MSACMVYVLSALLVTNTAHGDEGKESGCKGQTAGLRASTGKVISQMFYEPAVLFFCPCANLLGVQRYNVNKKGNFDLQLRELWVSLEHSMLCPGHLKYQAHSFRLFYFPVHILGIKAGSTPISGSFLGSAPCSPEHHTLIVYVFTESLSSGK